MAGDTHGDFRRLRFAAIYEQAHLRKEDALQSDIPTEMMSGDTLAISRWVSTFYLSKLFTSTDIKFCPL